MSNDDQSNYECILFFREGVGYMLLFSALVGLFSVLLVFCSALAWPHLGRRFVLTFVQCLNFFVM